MDALDINTRLPPRKRLLAGFKKVNSDFDFPIPNGSVFDHLRCVINSGNSSPEEVIEASKLAASAAAEVAGIARAAAVEKAAAAVKARNVARDALELLALITESEGRKKKGCVNRMKSKKKHVPIKLLYKNKQPGRRCETDEELARRLHRAMNSSPRISNHSDRKHRSVDKEGNGDVVIEGIARSNKRIVEPCVDANLLLKEKLICSNGISGHGSKVGAVSAQKKAKIMRKKLYLSQCDNKDLKPKEPKEVPASLLEASSKEERCDHEAKSMHLIDGEKSDGGELSTKISSMWKCKKLRVSECASDGKIMHVLCSNPSASKPTALVKVD